MVQGHEQRTSASSIVGANIFYLAFLGLAYLAKLGWHGHGRFNYSGTQQRTHKRMRRAVIRAAADQGRQPRTSASFIDVPTSFAKLLGLGILDCLNWMACCDITPVHGLRSFFFPDTWHVHTKE